MSTRSNRAGLIIAALLIVGLGIACLQAYSRWTQVIQVPPEEASKDYFGKIIAYLLSDPLACLFGQTQGSGPFLQYFSIGLMWIWASYGLGRWYPRWKHVADKLFWSSFEWCGYATVIVMAAWIFGASAQHFQWYACFPETINGISYQCQPGQQGTMDVGTHYMTLSALGAIFATVNFKDVLGLYGRRGRLLEFAINMLLLGLIVINFEVIESGNPAVYVNVIWNSVSDMLVGIAGGLTSNLGYNLVVPYEE
jgi:hypothetical protein